MAISFIGGGKQTFSHNVVLSTTRHDRVQTHVSCDRHWLHK